MEKGFTILTNNPLVMEKLGEEYHIEYSDISYEDILIKARDCIYRGHALLSHPLSGSVKPNETPYKSIMISVGRSQLDQQSVEVIESAIAACRKFEKKYELYAQFRPEVFADFQLVDFTLIDSAIGSVVAW